uniref:Odorant receptor n=1 Tax=Adelphocoris lineolatus TaxID=236346 RepID=A0A2I4PH67_ADELI|nr:olfactory receptor 57 [Adelphocoris lineolatus]
MFARPNMEFVQTWHYYGYWNIFLGGKYDSYKKVALVVRLILFTAGAFTALAKISSDGVESVLNGALIYVPLCVYTFVIPTILFFKRKNLFSLLKVFDECWASLNDEEDRAVFEDYYQKTWKFVRIIHVGLFCQLTYYITFPILYSLVFHYIFDVLSQPYILSYPHMSYLDKNFTWNGEYYAVVFAGVYCIAEIEFALLGWVLMYVVIVGYCYPVLVVTRNAVQAVGSNRSPSSGDRAMKKAVVAHSLLVKVNQDLKAFLGLPCAFQSIFTSLCLTLSVFTTIRSSDYFVEGAYGSAIILYSLSCLLYCSLGQILENQSEKLFEDLYNLPWYQFSPLVRKDLNMMLRQAGKPFTIDFHGGYNMNLENYMEILKSAYSFFTLLETLASNT